ADDYSCIYRIVIKKKSDSSQKIKIKSLNQIAFFPDLSSSKTITQLFDKFAKQYDQAKDKTNNRLYKFAHVTEWLLNALESKKSQEREREEALAKDVENIFTICKDGESKK
ncbi:hypothetical protein HY643_02075, partial [Candidatus Woesearchaeota archaeon]|nr:hypothetical protein [Candidatus Woesearchaeota archaeon]